MLALYRIERVMANVENLKDKIFQPRSLEECTAAFETFVEAYLSMLESDGMSEKTTTNQQSGDSNGKQKLSDNGVSTPNSDTDSTGNSAETVQPNDDGKANRKAGNQPVDATISTESGSHGESRDGAENTKDGAFGDQRRSRPTENEAKKVYCQGMHS